MSHFNKQIYEDLISNTQFVDWASGKSNSEKDYWLTWQDEYPHHSKEFKEACKTIQMLTFKPPKISDGEIAYLWNKTKSRIKVHSKVKFLHKATSLYGKIAAILTIPLLLGGLWLYQNNVTIKSEYERISEFHRTKLLTVKAPFGGRLNFELPDGSQVWLNSGTEIKYPAYFENNKREVNIQGEAYFKIKKSDTPFIVSNDGPPIKVYGTEFNVNAYEENDHIIVALASGKISLKMNNEEVFLSPNEISSFNKKNNKLTIQKSDIERFSCWREGKYIFRDTSLSSIIKTLQRHFNVKIEITDPEIADYIYNATIKEESFEQILDLLSLSAPIKYQYKRQSLKDDGTYSQAEVIITKDKNRIIN